MVSLAVNFTLLFTLVIWMNLASDSSCDLLGCDSVKFYLVNRGSPAANSPTCLNQTNPPFEGLFNASKPTKVLVHGWINNRNTEFPSIIEKRFLNVSDVNVIKVDWFGEAKKDYVTARKEVPDVAQTIAAFVQRLVDEFNMELADVHLVGHSLGAHIVGIVGYHFKAPKQIGRVTGLDPAGPLFSKTSVDGRISEESGAFVDILHTCMGVLGTTTKSGHADFYPNGGTPSQPGCFLEDGLVGACSHERAVRLLYEALKNPTSFVGTKCSSYLLYTAGLCSDNPTAYFNGEVDVEARGKYYFHTAAFPPYALPSLQEVNSSGICL